MIPETKYFRFNPVDSRCDIDLDEIDKQALKRLREATDEYVKSENERFGELCQLLQPDALDEEIAAVIATGLGSKKGVLVIEAQRYENEFAAKTDIVEEFCALRSIPFARIDTSSSYNPANTGFSLGKTEPRVRKVTTTITVTPTRRIILLEAETVVTVVTETRREERKSFWTIPT